MKIVGLITEYNPFHNGHLYHLEESKRVTNSNYSVVVMSGNFLQRGEPALVDKWARAKMAIESGVDLVIELPAVYACQSAEFFAYGAIKLLNDLNVVDSICFGSEAGDINGLKKIADILTNEPVKFKEYLKLFLDNGVSYPKARQQALSSYISEIYAEDCLAKLLESPNNILAIEYLKALNWVKGNMIPYTIKRVNSDYNSTELTGDISSATAIRSSIISNNSLDEIKHAIPNKAFNTLNLYFSSKRFNDIENFSQILFYILQNTSLQKLKSILNVDEGLENRIYKCGATTNSVNELIACVSTKRYTDTRIRRILIHLLLNLDKDCFYAMHKSGPQYVRVLGMNNKGFEILKKVKKKSNLPVVIKFADYKKIDNPFLKEMINFDAKATDIYYLGLKNYKGRKSNLDYYISPFIMNK